MVIVESGNLLSTVADTATLVYNEVMKNDCVHFKGTATLKEMISDRAVDNDSAVSITLQEAGILDKGKLLQHTTALGKRGAKEYKIGDIDKIVTGTEALIDGTYDFVLTKGEKFFQLPKEYRQKGMVYFYDDSMAISAGKDGIYTLVEPLFHSWIGGHYKRVLAYGGKVFNSPILAILVPLNKVEEKPVEPVRFVDNTQKTEELKEEIKKEETANDIESEKTTEKKKSKTKAELTIKWDEWEQALKDTAIQLKVQGVQHSDKGSKAGEIKDVTNSAGYIQEALYNIKYFPKGEDFYLSKDLFGTKRGVEAINKFFTKVHTKSSWKNAHLKPGDICGFEWGDGANTMVFAGTVEENGEVYPVWYAFGSTTPFSDTPVRKQFYETKTVKVKLKPKNLNK